MRMSAGGLEGERSYPTESGDDIGTPLPAPVGLVAAALDAFVTWLAPSRQSRVVKVPELRGRRASETFLPALRAGVRLDFVRLTEHPAPTDGLVEMQDPLPGTRVKRDSTVVLIVRHPEDPAGKKRS
jgi:beta-lactam-binding protein with PASTA domain